MGNKAKPPEDLDAELANEILDDLRLLIKKAKKFKNQDAADIVEETLEVAISDLSESLFGELA